MYVAREQLITPIKAQPCVAFATLLPSSTVDQSTIITDIFNKILCMLPVLYQTNNFQHKERKYLNVFEKYFYTAC